MLAKECGGIAWWRVGQGKTRVALAAFLYYPFKIETSQLCVFARPEAFDDWKKEAAIMGMEDQLMLKSYGQLSTQSADALVRDVIGNSQIGMVCFDELYLYKNPKSLRAMAANSIAERKPTVGLSGSIMTAKRMEDIYGQCQAVNKHKRIARSMTTFREEYMIGINEFGSVRWAPQRGAYAKLMESIKDFVHVYMPKNSSRQIVESIIEVDETSQQEQIFKELQETLSLPEHGIELSSAASLIIKVQQVANGWIRSQRLAWLRSKS